MTTTAVLLAGASACRGSDASPSADGARPTGELRVFAASSLTDAFEAMAEDFEAGQPGVEVLFNFGASSTLVQQLAQGAPADVVATADQVTMEQAADEGDVAAPQALARNRLTILVPKGNPGRIGAVRDLGRPDVTVVLCAPEVPCGRLAETVLQTARVEVHPASLEENARAVAAKVVLGEADAGIVYVTDAKAESARADTVGIDVPAAAAVETVYSIAVAADAEDPDAARAWIDFALSGQGQAILARWGFLPP